MGGRNLIIKAISTELGNISLIFAQKEKKQAGAELGKAQSKLGLDFVNREVETIFEHWCLNEN